MTSREILGVRVDVVSSKKHFREIFMNLVSKKGSKIFTINPEFIVDAYRDSKFKKVLNSADLNTIDGFGVALFLKFKLNKEMGASSLKLIKDYFNGSVKDLVLTGVSTVEEVLKILNEESMSLFILGGSPEEDVSYKSFLKISNKYPKINIIGYSSDFSYKAKDDSNTLNFIHSKMKEKGLKKIDVILVAYGHKNQEFWIERNASQIPAGISIGVGGTLDFISGKVRRAPLFLQSFGLEWLYRLLMEPRRITRIFKATVVFTILASFFDQKKATNNQN